VTDCCCASVLCFFGLSFDGSSRTGPFFQGGGSGDFVGELLVPYNEKVAREERRVGVPTPVASLLSTAALEGPSLPGVVRDLRGDRRGVTCEGDALN
jgi:hypothetical protein